MRKMVPLLLIIIILLPINSFYISLPAQNVQSINKAQSQEEDFNSDMLNTRDNKLGLTTDHTIGP